MSNEKWKMFFCFPALPTAALLTPAPAYIVGARQFIKISSKRGPVVLRFVVQSITTHELIYTGCAIQDRLHICRSRLVTIEMIMQTLGLLVEIFNKGVDVILTSRAIEPALVQR